LLVFEGISLQSEAQQEIERVATELRQFIETANAPIFGIDQDGLINEWNLTAQRITGFDKALVVGKHLVEDFITANYKAPVQEVLEKALRGEETANYEFPLYTKSGERLMVLLNATTRRNARGEIVGVMGVGQDITEIIHQRENLEEMVEERTNELNRSLADTEKARDRTDAILKSIADGLIVTDNYNRIILMNRAAEDILAIRFSEVIDRPIDFAIKDNVLRDEVKATLKKKETGLQFDFELPRPGSTQPRILRGQTSVVLDKAGNKSGIITIISDVTHEREIDRIKTEFMSTAAHELRTPLTSIQGFSEVLLTRGDSISVAERRKFIAYINEEATALSRIVNDLLDLSRIESGGGYSMSKVLCEPDSLLRQVVEHFSEASPDHQFEIELPKTPIDLWIDKEKIAQVVKNIVSNAVKYAPAGGRIRVSARYTDDMYQVAIEDEGIGMSRDQVAKIFDKFYRAAESGTAVQGTGLGMNIVKKIVAAHDGRVWVESAMEKGTTVRFCIPRGSEEDST